MVFRDDFMEFNALYTALISVFPSVTLSNSIHLLFIQTFFCGKHKSILTVFLSARWASIPNYCYYYK